MSPPRAPPLALRAVRAYLSDFVLGDVNDLEDIHNLQAIFKYPKDGLSVCTGNDKLDAGTKYGAYKQVHGQRRPISFGFLPSRNAPKSSSGLELPLILPCNGQDNILE
jgi:hypothetical protein